LAFLVSAEITDWPRVWKPSTRALGPAEAARLPNEVRQRAAQAGDVGAGRAVIQAMAIGPEPIPRSELGAGAIDGAGGVKLTPLGAASALSFSLTDAAPEFANNGAESPSRIKESGSEFFEVIAARKRDFIADMLPRAPCPCIRGRRRW
jgi:hypothetical protein